jgi:hypothetical protein
MAAWETIADFVGRKYLGEIAREVINSFRKKSELHRQGVMKTSSIPAITYLVYLPEELDRLPIGTRNMVKKAQIRCSFITDQLNRKVMRRQSLDGESLNRAEISQTSKTVAEKDSEGSLPEIDDLIFRGGMNEREFARQMMKDLLEKLPQWHDPGAVAGFKRLAEGKSLVWEKNYLNMNHRLPELFELYQKAWELKPDLEAIKDKCGCDQVIIGRNSPFKCYILLSMTEFAGVIVAFQES